MTEDINYDEMLSDVNSFRLLYIYKRYEQKESIIKPKGWSK